MIIKNNWPPPLVEQLSTTESTVEEPSTLKEEQELNWSSEESRLSLPRLRQALAYSDFVYSDLPDAEQFLLSKDYLNVKTIANYLTGTQVLCFVRDRRACIVFRGTTSPLDMLIDLLFLPVPVGPTSHLGFCVGWWGVALQIRRWLKKHSDAFDAVGCYGHSLGGALALICARQITPQYLISEVITFGTPKTFWLWGASSYERKKINDAESLTLGDVTFRIVNGRDAVARIPPKSLGYFDVGYLSYIDLNGIITHGSEAEHVRSMDGFAIWDSALGALDSDGDAIGAIRSQRTAVEQPAFPYTSPSSSSLAQWWDTSLLKTILTPVALYLAFCFYLIRSGQSHVTAKYTKHFFNGFAPPELVRLEPSVLRKIGGKLWGSLLGVCGLAVGLFLLFILAKGTIWHAYLKLTGQL